ncbi:hypothetical protein HELRODRAFT_175856 [Helobdella robusta]|uniref:Uncharacterized protein n=1 Tax=Helobdella robusta TaxID=6412 RepID=T1F9S5_HELRO|nr:hypothetical protein HELRODRAFT_175856 [Helobdella robusta]ESO00433.1 hypothetical protein HELRODRAFT_175856 [Helobdella robusta]
MASNSNCGALTTRSMTNIWLIGQLQIEKKTVPESAKLSSDKVMDMWNKARIPTTYHTHVVEKVKSVVDDYKLIKKNKNRQSEAQRAREKEFEEKEHMLFDIAHQHAKQLIRIQEDIEFLEDQRGSQRMQMSGIDKDLTKKEERTEQRKCKEEERKEREQERMTESTSLHLSSSDDSDSEQQDTEDNYEIEIPVYYKKQISEVEDSLSSSASKKTRTVQDMLSSPDVASALDRINLSDRKFTVLAAAIAQASGQDIRDTSLSRSTVHRKRQQHRSTIDSSIRQQFQDRDRNPLLVHWDGKIMNDDLHSRTDRLAVVVTGCNVEKILGIVKIASSTGQAQANATFQLLKLWDVSEDIIGMCFDTTAANTGTSSEACVLLEKLLHRNLLHFACRHHVHELIIGEVFTVLFGPSRGPNIGMFERFRAYWPNINQSNHKPLDDDRMNHSLLQMMRSDIVPSLTCFLSADSSYIPREDYKELVELCLLVLGYPMQTDGKYHFRVPGAYHMARWMAKVIYCLKMYLFRNEFKLTTTETKSLTEFCLFATHIYVPAWMLCPIPSDAPVNDLQLLSRIEQYSEINKNVASAATKKLKNHLWYLGTEMVWLSLFSNKVANAEKQLIVESMTAVDSDWSVRGVKYPATELEQVKSKPLHDLVSGTSRATLLSLGMDVAILRETEPDSWNDLPLFQKVANVVKSLKVVNDTAERTVALMTNFNQSITKNETELQKLIQVVEDNRIHIPDSSKRTLASAQAAAAMF